MEHIFEFVNWYLCTECCNIPSNSYPDILLVYVGQVPIASVQLTATARLAARLKSPAHLVLKAALAVSQPSSLHIPAGQLLSFAAFFTRLQDLWGLALSFTWGVKCILCPVGKSWLHLTMHANCKQVLYCQLGIKGGIT